MEVFLQAKHEMSTLDWPGAVEDIRGAARFLKEQGAQKGMYKPVPKDASYSKPFNLLD